MSELSIKQRAFPPMVAKLVGWAYTHGYELSYGEVLRRDSTATANALAGIGIQHSLHLLSLAVDFNLFKNGIYLTDTESYRPLGEFWESLGGSWGGRFSKPDGNHFSLSYQGVR